MAFKKFASAEVEDIISIRAWQDMHGKQSFKSKTAASKVVVEEQSRYLLSHCTIMASVMTEDEPNDYWIKPESSLMVNNNQDAWENTVLALSYKSFRGAFNFVEHYQNTKASKGHLLDVVLRKLTISKSVWVYYADLLVATDLKHEELVGDIRSGKTKYMSMGCTTDLVICSFCGARCTAPATYCTHLKFQKGNFLFDEGGVPRRVAELCGHKSLPNGGVHFVEASWVGTPAFPGAAQRGIVSEEFLGPKTPYTHAASLKKGIQKAASLKQKTDAQLKARFDRLFK